MKKYLEITTRKGIVNLKKITFRDIIEISGGENYVNDKKNKNVND